MRSMRKCLIPFCMLRVLLWDEPRGALQRIYDDTRARAAAGQGDYFWDLMYSVEIDWMHAAYGLYSRGMSKLPHAVQTVVRHGGPGSSGMRKARTARENKIPQTVRSLQLVKAAHNGLGKTK